MLYSFTVTVKKVKGYDNHYTYQVVAQNAERAVYRAIRQARKDSGCSRYWDVTNLERHGYVVS